MGIIVQLATFSASLALLTVCTRHVQHICRRSGNEVLRRFSNFLLCCGIATLLWFGWASDPRLDTLIAAALVCWFTGYAIINLAQMARGILPPFAILGMLIYIFAAGMAFDASHDLHLFGYAAGGVLASGILFASAFTLPNTTDADAEQDGKDSKQPTKK